MKLRRPSVPRPSTAVLLGLLVVAGAGCVLAGVYLLAGLPWALVAGGAAAVAFGLTKDVSADG